METIETQKKVQEVYLKFVEKGELIRIDGDKPADVVAKELFVKVSGLINAFRDLCFSAK
jgi:thymidylate kinase